MRAVLVLIALCAACGARSELRAPDAAASDDAGPPMDAPGPDACTRECYATHQCCVGGCDGRAIDGLRTCCACPAGSVNSFTCRNGCGRH